MTIETICCIVGAGTGMKWETNEVWSALVMSRHQTKRAAVSRAIVYLVLQEVLNVSYVEIARIFDRDTSVIHRSLQTARRWRQVHGPEWAAIREGVLKALREERETAAGPASR